MAPTEYRSEQDIDSVLTKVRQIWLSHNYLSLPQLIKGLAARKSIPISKLSDTALKTLIEKELNESD